MFHNDSFILINSDCIVSINKQYTTKIVIPNVFIIIFS